MTVALATRYIGLTAVLMVAQASAVAGEGSSASPDAGAVFSASFEQDEAPVEPPQPSCGSSITDPTRVVALAPLARPALGEQIVDPGFGGCLTRVTDAAAFGRSVPIYSKLQAWNADSSKLLLANRLVLHAADFSLFSESPATVPELQWVESPKWSAVEPDVIFATAGNELRRHDVEAGTYTSTVFAEYEYFARNASFEELSRDSRYTAMAGIKPDGHVEVFVYDVIAGSKSPVAAAIDSSRPTEPPVWLMVSPLARHVIARWNSQDAIFAYDMQMNLIGKLANGGGHSDIAVDAEGVEWYVDFAASDPRSDVTVRGPVVRKSRIPGGYSAWQKGDTEAVQVLINLDWGHGGHVSCRGPIGLGWCVLSTYSSEPDEPFGAEIVRLYLDSIDCWRPGGASCTPSDPHIERLAHHRSEPNSCGYWAQPHATIDRDGRRILFGSTWGGGDCERIESYLIELPPEPRPAGVGVRR